jgi:hypothetical protein
MRTLLIVAAAVLAAGCATTHQAAHVGFHASADIGLAYSASSATSGGDTAKVSGTGGAMAVSMGGAVVPNLILGGQFWLTTVSDPTMTLNGSSATASDTTYTVYGFGPMLKYYWMPSNLYLSATPSLTRLSLRDEVTGSTGETEWGIGLRAALGKEWYVSRTLGLGLAGVLDVSSNKDTNGGPTWTSWGGGLVFSVSFN